MSILDEAPSDREKYKFREEDMIVWHLKKGLDRRFRTGHPWVFSNELLEKPKGVSPGESIELRDSQNQFLARGFGNPHSLIAFREMTRSEKVRDPFSGPELFIKLWESRNLRHTLGFENVSYRLCFGEADFLPGLVIDRYRLPENKQVFVVQAHSAGMDKNLNSILDALQKLTEQEILEAPNSPSWDNTAVVLRNDMKVRELEGLAVEEPRALKSIPGINLNQVQILIASATRSLSKEDPLLFTVDLLGGQKTGFFLDQFANIEITTRHALNWARNSKGTIRILDLCCYVGQWSAQLSSALKAFGHSVHVTCVDASDEALKLASLNVAPIAEVQTIKMDVLKGLPNIPDQSFDIVICDPPAFIKGRKDIEAGRHAYLKMNTEAVRIARKHALFVTCSCSGLLKEDEFLETISKASRRAERQVRWFARGGHAPDHPTRVEFPEGTYLKCWIGLVDSPRSR